MVRGGLERQVQGHLEAELAGAGHEGVEVVHRPEVGVDRVVAAVLGPDGPRRAGVVGAGGEGVVGALAVDLADGVDRRQVDDVEAGRGDGVEPLRRGAERAGARLPGRGVLGGPLAAGEELVPAAEQRALAVGVRRVGPLDGDQLAQRVLEQHLRQLGVAQGREPSGGGALGVLGGQDRALEHLSSLGVGGLEGGGDALEEQPPLEEHQLDVHTRGDLDARVVLPGGERVGPRLHLEAPGTLEVGGHPRLVQVRHVGVLDHPHRRTTHARGVGQHHLGRELVVALPEDRRGDPEGLADGRLRGLPTEVHQWHHVHDGDASDHAH